MAELKAQAIIPFRKAAIGLETIAESLSAHNLTLRVEDDVLAVMTPFGGVGRLRPAETELHVFIEATTPGAFNRLKYDLTSLIEFVAKEDALQIAWTGDAVGATLPPDLRVLTVREIRGLTPGMRRITFEGERLDRFAVSDQIHGRLLFPEKGTGEPQWPRLGDDGRIEPLRKGSFASRIYTIRSIDAALGSLAIDFVMHEGTGPGIGWASAAVPGDVVGIVGPAARGPRPADWYLLAGDETGLPGIARILEGMPASAKGTALIEVADASEEQELDGPPGIEVRWLHRNGAAPGTTRQIAKAVRELELPSARDGIFFWGGAEFSTYRDIRSYLRKEVGLPATQLVAFSHWRRGMSEEDIAKAGASAISA